MMAFGIQTRRACKMRRKFISWKQKGTCGHCYNYVYAQEPSHRYYGHVFHDRSCHVIDQWSIYFTLQQLNGTLGFHKKQVSECSILFSIQPYIVVWPFILVSHKVLDILLIVAARFILLLAWLQHGFRVWKLNRILISDIWIWLCYSC